jgi:UrcA family protein
MSRPFTRPLFAAALACLAAPAVPALAAPQDVDGVTLSVALADLDLTRGPDARTALRRIRIAARDVCGGNQPQPLELAAARDACVAQSVERTVTRLDRPLLTALNGASRTAPTTLADNR